MKIIIILLKLSLIIITTSCNDSWYKPGAHLLDNGPKTGSPGFLLGWRHGCESGISGSFTGNMFMYFWDYKRDPELMRKDLNTELLKEKYAKELPINWNDSEEVKKMISDYKQPFWSAHAYCRHYGIQTLQMSDMAPANPKEARYVLGSHNVGSIWRLDARGDNRLTFW